MTSHPDSFGRTRALNERSPRMDTSKMTDDELVTASQGCSEWSCIYHGVFNQERARRRQDGAA